MIDKKPQENIINKLLNLLIPPEEEENSKYISDSRLLELLLTSSSRFDMENPFFLLLLYEIKIGQLKNLKRIVTKRDKTRQDGKDGHDNKDSI